MIVDVRYPKFSFKLDLDARHHTQRRMLEIISRGSLYEPESSFIADRIKPGDAFLDCGAHIGYYSMVAAHAADKQVLVHSYEPNSENYQRFLRTIELNDCRNVFPHHCALAERDYVGSLSLNADNDGGHCMFPVGDHPEHVKTRALGPRSERIWVKSAQSAIRDHCQEGELWVKADVEGCEALIVRSILDYDREPIFILEINRGALQGMGSSEDELRDILYARGYKSYVHSAMKLTELKKGDYVQGNYVFNAIFWPARLPSIFEV